MARTISLAARNTAEALHSDDGFLLLLTAWPQDGETAAIRVVNNNEDIISRGVTYVAYPFEITLPGDDDERVSQATITIDNVTGDILDTLRQINGDVNILLEVVLISNPSDVVMATNGLKLRRITVSDTTISGDILTDTIYQVTYPAEDYTPASTPGIFR
jgi:hypothetical protein